MLPFLGDRFGNASSGHVMGRPLREAVEHARSRVASLLGCSSGEIVFNSGGTEGCNHVIKGLAAANANRKGHIIISAVEHPAVVNPCRFLESQGYEITFLPVDETGRVDPEEVAGEVRPNTFLISVMHANNEVGAIQPIREIAEIAREGGVLVHTDAAQSCGKLLTDVRELGVDFLTLAGHKLYAPQGIGALYIREGVTIEPLHHGAGHEQGRRSGTEPVASIVALGKAAELAMNGLRSNAPMRLTALRDRLWNGLNRALGDRAVLLGHPVERLPNTLNVGFRGLIGADILADCPGLCASTGAACHPGKRRRSATLTAMNVPEEIAFGAIRFSVGRFTTETEIDEAVTAITRAATNDRPASRSSCEID